jgi:hypothetical protein
MKDANNILIWSCRFQWEHFSKIWRKITDFHVQKRNKQIFVSYGLGEIIALPWKLNGQSLSNLYTCKGSRILGFVSLLQQGTSLNKYIYNANGKTNVEFMFLLGNHCVCSTCTYEPQLRQNFSNHIKSLTYIHFLYIEVYMSEN